AGRIRADDCYSGRRVPIFSRRALEDERGGGGTVTYGPRNSRYAGTKFRRHRVAVGIGAARPPPGGGTCSGHDGASHGPPKPERGPSLYCCAAHLAHRSISGEHAAQGASLADGRKP